MNSVIHSGFTFVFTVLLVADWSKATTKWSPSRESNQTELVKFLRRRGDIKSDIVAEVMTLVDRQIYVPNNYYKDVPQFTTPLIMEYPPHMTAFVLETLKDHLQKDKNVLIAGFGSGYMAACMGLMVGEYGQVVALEFTSEQVEYAEECVSRDKALLSRNIKIKFFEANLRRGNPNLGPYDVIYVLPTAPKVPEALLEQMERGCRMLIPLGTPDRVEEMAIFDKGLDKKIVKTVVPGYFYAHRILWATVPWGDSLQKNSSNFPDFSSNDSFKKLATKAIRVFLTT